MEPRDFDDRILEAARSDRDPPRGETPDEQVLLDDVGRIGAAARRAAARADGSDGLETPPAGIWDSIEARLAPEPAASSGDVVSLDRARAQRRWLVGVAAAAVAAVVIAVVGIAVTDDEPAGREVATVMLDPLAGAGSGNAVLVDDDGRLVLDVAIDGVDPAGGYLEVWLLDPAVTELVSLGPARDDGRYEIPAGLDVAVVPVVDVSIEPFDGDPGHSGASVLRGILPV